MRERLEVSSTLIALSTLANFRFEGIKQGPWVSNESHHLRRELSFQIEATDLLGMIFGAISQDFSNFLSVGRSQANEISDYQIIDVLNDHLCYVVTDKRTPWHLPFKRSFRLVSKIVITFVSKGKSKLAVYTKIEWLWTPYGLQSEFSTEIGLTNLY